MSELTVPELLSRLEEAEAVIRKLLLATSYEDFQRQRPQAERTKFTLREILDAQNRRVRERLDLVSVNNHG